MILVTGATGQIGGAATRSLLAAGVPVRALVRAPGRATGIDGAELATGSFDDEQSLARAFSGVSAVLLAGRDNPHYATQMERVIAAAERAGVEHVVALSAIGASAASPIALMRDHAEVEARVRAGTARWTLLRPHLYMQNLLRAAGTVRAEGRLAAPMGDLALPFADGRDVGAAAAVVLRDPEAHAGVTHVLTGPIAQTYASIADALTRLLERPVAYDAVEPEAYLADLLAAGMPSWRARDLAFIASAYAPDELVASPGLATLLGRPPRSLLGFLEEHRGAFLSP
jgi:uncharacterized protein YbjT (DUF2867 family)